MSNELEEISEGMEAKVMKPVEPCIGCFNRQVDDYGYLCDLACGKRTAWLNQIVGYQAGINDVVKWVEGCSGGNIYTEKDGSKSAIPIMINYRKWQAQLKSWRVNGEQ